MKTKTCTASGKQFVITDEDLAFYARMDVPEPTLCPEEVLRSMMLHRNERVLYRRKCDLTGKPLISAYDKEAAFPVYENSVWWGDDWDGTDFGRDFDQEIPFFDQFKALQNVVPREGTSVFNSENSDFNSHTRECKDCYLNTLAVKSESTHYCYWAVGNMDVVDSLITNNSELCYEAIDCENCYECVMVMDCHNSQHCAFSTDLRGCHHCIGCNNLRNKSYYIFNKPVSETEFQEFWEKVMNGSHAGYQQGIEFFRNQLKTVPHQAVMNTSVENVTGNHLINCKDCKECFDGDGSEDCAYSVALNDTKDTYFASSAGWPGCELIYYSTVSRGCTNLRFCYYTWFSQDLDYCDSCVSCSDCFGCIGLKHKKYCILNKQYSKEDYSEAKERLIAHMRNTEEWGSFFSPELSTFAYNHSQAQEYFPLTNESATQRGYAWKAIEGTAQYDGPKFEIPQNIDDVGEDILEAVLTCDESGKNFRIIKSELGFYRKMNLPIPRLCPDERHLRRLKLRNPRELHDRKCSTCECEIKTTYAPDRPEKVLCEKCYQEQIS